RTLAEPSKYPSLRNESNSSYNSEVYRNADGSLETMIHITLTYTRSLYQRYATCSSNDRKTFCPQLMEGKREGIRNSKHRRGGVSLLPWLGEPTVSKRRPDLSHGMSFLQTVPKDVEVNSGSPLISWRRAHLLPIL